MKKTQIKTLRFGPETDSKLKQLVDTKNAKYEGTGHSRISENQVLIEAVNYLHASTYGKDIFEQETERLQMILGNVITVALRGYADPFAAALNHLSAELEYLKICINLMMANSKILASKSQKEAEAILKSKWNYEDLLMEIIIKNRTEN